MKASAYEAATGKRLWEVVLAATGEVRQVVAGADGKTCYVLATSDGGRIMVIHDGRLTQTLPAEGGRAITAAPDGSRIAFVAGNQLKLCSLADGLQWILPADDALHAPRISPDGKRIAACGDIGSVYVVGSDGRAPPQEWQVVHVDLWEVIKKPVRIRGPRLATRGGAAVFDQILLSRREKDLPSKK